MASAKCVICEEPASGHHSLPIGHFSCDVVGVSFKGEWGANAACEQCYKLHAAVRIPSDPDLETSIVVDVLSTYSDAVRTKLALLNRVRVAASTFRDVLEELD